MSSLARRQANRRNAQKSTGPKSGSGKRKSSRNALSHGLSQPIDPSQVGDTLDQLQNLLIKSGYQPTHAHRVALCLMDYDRVDRAECSIQYRMACLASARALTEINTPDGEAPLPLDDPKDLEIAVFHLVCGKLGLGKDINKLPPGGAPAGSFWEKIVSGKHLDRYRRRSLNQLLKALMAQNDDYKV